MVGLELRFGPNFEATKQRMAPAMPFAHKTKLVWPGVYNNPPEALGSGLLGLLACVFGCHQMCHQVGPGTFERKDKASPKRRLSRLLQHLCFVLLQICQDAAIGQQHLSKRRNQSTHAFAKGPKFGRAPEMLGLKRESVTHSPV